MVLGRQEKESIAEVLEILDYMEEKEIKKIPSKFLRFLQDNKDNNYKKHIDANIDINSQISKNKTKAILGMILYNFLCNKDEKKEFEKILKENEIKNQEELSKNFNYDDLFKKKRIEKCNEMLPIIKKQTWYQKLITTLKKFFI